MNKYCDNCNKNVDTKIIVKNEEYDVFSEKIKVEAQVRVCEECGKELFDEQLDNETLKKAYEIYKKNNNLLSVDEIIEIRNKYGLSQRSLAKLLGWGDKTIFRYENGSIQDKTHNYILEQLKSEKNMLEYLEKHKDSIDIKLYNKILSNINENTIVTTDNQISFDYDPTIYSGYKTFDLKKICAMIEFFVDKFENIQITKLLKLLNYSDMLFFKENTVSISGLRYIHYPYGPMPENYRLILNYMISNGLIDETYKFDENYEYHYYNSSFNKNIDSLNFEEKQILETVYEKFKNFGSKEISDYSHLEAGYINTKNNEFISYEYANEINI